MAQFPQAGDSNIKVLSVVWYKVLPPKFGGQKAVAFFNEYLAEIAPVICLCSRNNEAVNVDYPVYDQLPVSKWQFVNPVIWRRIFVLAKRQQVTHLILEFPYHGIAGFFCQKLLRLKLIVNTHNIEFFRFKEQGKWWWRHLYYFEKWTLKKADAVFFKTQTDKETAVKQFNLDAKKLSVIPYGVEDRVDFSKKESQLMIRQRHKIAYNEKLFLFAGTLDYRPNADALVAIKHRLIPLLDQGNLKYKVIICGRNKSEKFSYLNTLEDPRLIICGEVDDIDSYFNAADVFINPVLGGGGIQTKIMDALSYHLNVVCFESKTPGIAYAGNKIFSVEDGDWAAFAQAIHHALEKSEETPPAFFENYNWRTIAAKACQKIIES